MLETLVITFREGLESFLIVAIMLAYLKKTGRSNLFPAVYAGVGTAILISATAGFRVGELATNPLWEGSFALVAGLLVASMTAYVMKTAQTIRQSISDSIETRAAKAGKAAVISIFLFSGLMIAREGLETAFMLGTMSAEISFSELVSGACAGLALTALIGWMWVKQSHLINIRVFLQVTGIFLILFSLHLFLYGLHEMTEASILPIDNFYWHTLTEPVDENEPLGKAITYSLLVIPCVWLAISYIREKFFKRTKMAA